MEMYSLRWALDDLMFFYSEHSVCTVYPFMCRIKFTNVFVKAVLYLIKCNNVYPFLLFYLN